MMLKMKNIYIIFLLLLLFNCSENGNDSNESNPVPSVAILTFPENNQECNQGVEISNTHTTVSFTWVESINTDAYELVLKNLISNNISIHNSVINQLDITLTKATPYSWYIISKSNNTSETAQSEIWKFYNAGNGEEYHIPFPADLLSPLMGANLIGVSSVNLIWSGSDLDNDIVGYDVYVDTVSPPVSLISNSQISTEYSINVQVGNVYYWKIVTKDSQGNNSQSDIFEFRVD